MNYQKIYNDIIDRSKQRGWTRKNAGIYVEQHHIIPRSLGGDDSKDNLVFLTAREHFLAHWLLYKITTGIEKSKMASAWIRMCHSNNFIVRYSKHYAKARQALANEMSKQNPMKNPKTAFLVSEKLKGLMVGSKNGFYGKKHTKHTLHRISGNNHYTKKENYIPTTLSQGHKEAISRANKGRARQDLGEMNKDKASIWEISTPTGENIIIKNLNSWAQNNGVKASWLYKNRHGYKARKIC
jgi:hypothetical protein